MQYLQISFKWVLKYRKMIVLIFPRKVKNTHFSRQKCQMETLKILVSTDNHVGYMVCSCSSLLISKERDPVRRNDSFIAFEEVLKVAVEQDVDFVLLGGDLFHDNKPTRSTLYRVMALLRNYCIGDREIKISFLSDSSSELCTPLLLREFRSLPRTGRPNFEDPNINVAMPVFIIHGNHDDPTGVGLSTFPSTHTTRTELILPWIC